MSASTLQPSPNASSPKLLERYVYAARQNGLTAECAERAADWCRRFILFHGKRHPDNHGLGEVAAFLEYIAATDRNALVAIESARSALEFLFGKVLGWQLGVFPRPNPPRLLDQVKQVMRVKHYSIRTEESYAQWIKRYICFHGKRHPRNMGAAELQHFLTDLAVNGE
jgi:hypothetical protein